MAALVAPRMRTSSAGCSRVQWAWRASSSLPFASSLALASQRSNPGAVSPLRTLASTFERSRTARWLSPRHGGFYCHDDPGACHRPYLDVSSRCFCSSLPASDAATAEKQSSGVTTGAPATTGQRRRVAIVGAGPSGCYAAKYLQSGLRKHNVSCSIDVVDQQCVLGGLVRFGVAPDHPEVKNVLNDFEALFEGHQPSDDLSTSTIQFYGGVKVGRDVQLNELRSMYDAVVLAYGCESSQTMGIPGELEMSGVLSAREFVAWYNGHPDYLHIGEQVNCALNTSENSVSTTADHPASVVVIGHGNVALDCARILAKGADQLYHTDLAQHALPVLDGGVSQVSVIGRRGHVQAAFTIKEVRELVNLSQEGQTDAVFVVDAAELDLGMTPASQAELAENRPRQRIDKLLRDHASEKGNVRAASSTKRVNLRFLLNPVRFEGEDDEAHNDQSQQKQQQRRLGKVVCERTRLEGEAGRQRAVGTGEYEELEAQLAIVSVGYRGVPVPGLEPYFDDRRGTVVSEHGRVDPAQVNGHSSRQTSPTRGGLYVTGWLKRGPSGIIGTNISDAKETVAAIIKDLIDDTEPPSGPPSDDADIESLSSVLESRGVQFVDWHGYQRIVQQEFKERRSELQPREKITSFRRQVEIANSS